MALGQQQERRRIKSKWIEVKEIAGIGKIDLKPGQRVVDSKVLGEMIVLPRNGNSAQYAMPEYKTIIVLECVEYEDAGQS